jgi:hypothetical protein
MASTPCTLSQRQATGCLDDWTIRADIGTEDVILSGSAAIRGNPASTGESSASTSRTPGAVDSAKPTKPAMPTKPTGPATPTSPTTSAITPTGSTTTVVPPGSQFVFRDGYSVTSAPVVKLSDLIQFRPTPGVDHMEPNGWMVVGLDTNFYAMAATQVQRGMLLGQEASVRFTPVSYRWDYGDGVVRTLQTRGAPWASLGIAEFGQTSTSHVYRNPGVYSIALTINFAAEYKYAGMAWTRISGVLPVRANQLLGVAGKAKTVLVGHDCSTRSTGPGC